MSLSWPSSSRRDSGCGRSRVITLYEADRQLPVGRIIRTRVELPADRSFESWDRALAGMSRPRLANNTELFWQQGLLDVELEYPITSERSRFSIEPALARLGIRTMTVLRFLPPGSGERIFQYTGDHEPAIELSDLECAVVLTDDLEPVFHK